MIQVCVILYYWIESSGFVNQLLPHVTQLSNDNNPLFISNEKQMNSLSDDKWTSVSFCDDCMMDINQDIILSDYSSIQYILLQDNSFKHAHSLTISGISSLKVLAIERCSFLEANYLRLDSEKRMIVWWIDLSQLAIIKMGFYSFYKAKDLFIYSISYLFSLIYKIYPICKV